MSEVPDMAALGIRAAMVIADIALTLVAVALAGRLVRRLDLPQDPDDSDSDSGGGGGNDRRKGPPDRSGGGGEPEWWPVFEREFADYAAHTGRVASTIGGGSARAPSGARVMARRG
jgi:hypothetical protein